MGVSSSGGGLDAGVCYYNRLQWRIQALRLGGRTFFESFTEATIKVYAWICFRISICTPPPMIILFLKPL